MSEPLFLNSVMQEKIWGGLNYEMSLVTTFQAKKSENIGPSQLIQMECLR